MANVNFSQNFQM